MNIKLTDFGFSCQLEPGEKLRGLARDPGHVSGRRLSHQLSWEQGLPGTFSPKNKESYHFKAGCLFPGLG